MPGAPPPGPGGPAPALDALVGGACAFFDRLADLVPARFYHDAGEERLNLRYMKKDARGAARAAMKAKAKQKKRAKLDPSAPVTTVELQRTKAAAKAAAAAGGGGAAAGGGGKAAGGGGGGRQPPPQGARGGDAEPGPGSARQQEAAGLKFNIASGPAPSREELLRRLHQRLEAARSQRHAEDGAGVGGGGGNKRGGGGGAKGPKAPKSQGDQAKAWRQQQIEKQLKQAAGGKRKAEGDAPPPGKGQQQQGKQQQHQQQQHAHKKARVDPQQQQQQQGGGGGGGATTLQLSRVVISGDGHGSGPKKPKPSKPELLKAAQARAAAKGASGDDDGAKARASQLAWQSALARAQGEKVLDDPKLLRRSIKRDASKKKRSAKKWGERLGAQAEAKATRQERRTGNLAARSKTKKDNKKAKREKKLLRAGFEGRKAGFIAPKGGGGGGGGGGKQ